MAQSIAPAAAGLAPGTRCMLLGSTAAEVGAVRQAKELPGLASFEHEARRHARRRRGYPAPGSTG